MDDAMEGEESPPEILVERGHLFVTMDVPEIPMDALCHYVGTNLLVVWQRDEEDGHSHVVRFPVDVHPERAVLRLVNGVLDLEVPIQTNLSARPTPEGSR